MIHKINSIAVLTTTQNFAWNSMQEIIPGIEAVWEEIANNQNWKIKIIDVDGKRPSEHLHTFLITDLIICSAFNTHIALYIQFIRRELQLDQPIIFYLHGLATIGLWPLKRFGVFDLLTTHDIFVGTCTGDLNSLNIILENFRYIQTRFYLLDQLHMHSKKEKTAFVMITRLSPQKNIIQLIESYLELDDSIKESYPLIIYGNEDHLGYPNLGISVSNYLEQITSFIKKNNAESYVHLKGFVPRELINLEMSPDQIFISVSTHSDENFGMAALRSLLHGQKAVLTEWGGHKNFSQDFSNQITYVDVKIDSNGLPTPVNIKSALLKSIKSNISHKPITEKLYNKQYIAKKLYQDFIDILSNQKKSNLLFPKPIFHNIIKNQIYFEKENRIMQCFESTKDPSYLDLINAYLK